MIHFKRENLENYLNKLCDLQYLDIVMESFNFRLKILDAFSNKIIKSKMIEKDGYEIVFTPEKTTNYCFNGTDILLLLYLPINIEIEKSYGWKSESSDNNSEISEDEEMKDDFFSKYITLKENDEEITNSSVYIISDKSMLTSKKELYQFNTQQPQKYIT